MARPKIRFNGPFRGLVTELPADQLAPGMATQADDVMTIDGSVKTRPGFDATSSAILFREVSAWDDFQRKSATNLTSTEINDCPDGLNEWKALTQSSGTYSFDIVNNRARGSISTGAHTTCACALVEDTTSDEVTPTASYAVEFLLRKAEGFTGDSGTSPFTTSFDEDDVDVYFGIHLRSESNSHLDVAGNSDNSYEIEFTIPASKGAASPNDHYNRWDDLVLNLYKRSDGSRGAAVDTYSGTGEGPGSDEWIHVKAVVAGIVTPEIKVWVNGNLTIDYTDSSSPYTSTGYVRIHARTESSSNNDETLMRQIELGGLIVYTIEISGYTNAEANVPVRQMSSLDRNDDNQYFLTLAHNRLFSGLTTATHLSNTSPRLNRRDGIYNSTTGALLTYAKGNSDFRITDTTTGTSGGGLTDYSVTDGDRLEILWSDNQNIVLGLYEVDVKSTATSVRAKGIPSADLETISSSNKVAYRIIPARSSDGVMGITRNSTVGDGGSAIANNMVYFAEPNESPGRMLKSDGQAAHHIGIKGPTTAPTLANWGSGSATLGGTDYSYKFTYYDAARAIESNPSPETSDTALTNGAQITFSTYSISAGATNARDLNATHVRLYRQDVGASQTDWYLTRTIPVPIDTYQGNFIVYDDTDSGDESASITVPDAESNGIPPKSIDCEFHLDRMWWFESGTNKLWYSVANAPDQVGATSFVRVGEGDGEDGTGLIAGKSLLLDAVASVMLIIKEGSLWYLTGTSSSDFAAQKIANVGAAGPQCYALDEDSRLYLFGNDGIHRFDGQTAKPLHSAIRGKLFSEIDFTLIKQSAVGVDRERGLLLVALPFTSGSEQRVLAMAYRKPPIESDIGEIWDWYEWLSGSSVQPYCFATEREELSDTGGGRHKLRAGDDTGLIYTLGGEDGTATGDGATGSGNIDAIWTGPKLHGNVQARKHWRFLKARFTTQASSNNLSVGYIPGDDSTAITTTVDQSTRNNKLITVNRREMYLRPYFAITAAEPMQILGYEIDADVLGHR